MRTGGSKGCIPDEFLESAKLTNAAFTLSMANSGPNSGGSQFFVNVVDNDFLDWFDPLNESRHPVFGRVTAGQEVCRSISEVPTDADCPKTPVQVTCVTLEGVPPPPPPPPPPPAVTPADGVQTVPGHKTSYSVAKAGVSGAAITKGCTATVHAKGSVGSRQFWCTRDKGEEPFTYTAGVGEVIVGWDKGCLGMRVGEVRLLTIPADEGYEEEGFPAWGIPGGATLSFELECLDVKGVGVQSV